MFVASISQEVGAIHSTSLDHPSNDGAPSTLMAAALLQHMNTAMATAMKEEPASYITSTSYKIQERVISNAEWTYPKDGTSPQLLTYDISITLEDGQVLTATRVNNEESPIEMWAQGSSLEIMKERFFIQENNSWFRVKNLQMDKECDVWGPSRSQKLIFNLDHDRHTYGVEQIKMFTAPNGEKQLQFSFKNAFFSLPIVDEKFHGLYLGVPLRILQEEIVDLTSNFYSVKMQVMNLFTQEIISLTSMPMSLTAQGVVKSVEPFDINVKKNPNSAGRVQSWRLKIVMNDGQEFATASHTPVTPPSWDMVTFNGTGYVWRPEKIINPNEGIEILDERPIEGVFNRSVFSIKNINTNQIYDVEGPSRKPRI